MSKDISEIRGRFYLPPLKTTQFHQSPNPLMDLSSQSSAVNQLFTVNPGKVVASTSSFRRATEKLLSNGLSPQFPPSHSTALSPYPAAGIFRNAFKQSSSSLVEGKGEVEDTATLPPVPMGSTENSLQRQPIGDQPVAICLFVGESNERVYHTTVSFKPGSHAPLIQLNDIIHSVLGKREKQALAGKEGLCLFVESNISSLVSWFDVLDSDFKFVEAVSRLGAKLESSTLLLIVVANASDFLATGTSPLFQCPFELRERLICSGKLKLPISFSLKISKSQSNQNSSDLPAQLTTVQTVVNNLFPSSSYRSDSSFSGQEQLPSNDDSARTNFQSPLEDSEWTLI